MDGPGTRFAPPDRLDEGRVREQGEHLARDPLVARLLDSFPEPVVILNGERQIVLANDKLARLLARPREEVVGLRPGEALGCVHAKAEEAGCGTSEFCRDCGAVNAIVDSQKSGRAEVRECRIHCVSSPREEPADLDLRVWATPLAVDGTPFTVFAVRDTTDEKRRLVLERLFFHDVLNAAGGLHGLLEIWHELTPEETAEMEPMAERLARQVVEEIQAQRDLLLAEKGDLEVREEEIDATTFLTGLCVRFSHDPAAAGKRVEPPDLEGTTLFRADPVLLRRVAGNLLKNALEATAPGGTVTVSFRREAGPRISVHNDGALPDAVRHQVFQRSFSTKGEAGHGIGLYSVRLLTERYLRGRVSFTSDDVSGTSFKIELPG